MASSYDVGQKPEGDGMINERITIRLPEEILRKLDEIIKEEGYTNRSEFIRKAIIELINTRNKKSEEETKIAIAKDSNSRRITIEISEELYVTLVDLQSKGFFHGPIDVILSNAVEDFMFRYLREKKEEREKNKEIANSENLKVVR